MKLVQYAFASAFLLASCQGVEAVSASAEPAVETQSLKSKSAASFDVTRNQLRSAIERRGARIMAEVDHAAGAQSVDMELAPSTLFIFGNPRVGTPLMQINPEVGIDLPLKALVFEQGGEVFVLVSDIGSIATEANIPESTEALRKIENVLSQIADEATQAPTE